MLTRYQARLMAHPQPSSSIPASTRTDQNHQSFQNTKSITTTIQTGTYPILSTVANGEDQSKSYSNRDTTTRNVSSLAQTMPYPPNYDRRELIRDSFDSGLAEVGDSHLGNFSQNFSTINRNTLRENNFRANQTTTNNELTSTRDRIHISPNGPYKSLFGNNGQVDRYQNSNSHVSVSDTNIQRNTTIAETPFQTRERTSYSSQNTNSHVNVSDTNIQRNTTTAEIPFQTRERTSYQSVITDFPATATHTHSFRERLPYQSATSGFPAQENIPLSSQTNRERLPYQSAISGFPAHENQELNIQTFGERLPLHSASPGFPVHEHRLYNSNNTQSNTPFQPVVSGFPAPSNLPFQTRERLAYQPAHTGFPDSAFGPNNSFGQRGPYRDYASYDAGIPTRRMSYGGPNGFNGSRSFQKIKPPTFDGQSHEWPYFKRLFQEACLINNWSEPEQRYNLLNNLHGEARSFIVSIENQLSFLSMQGLLELLDKRFGVGNKTHHFQSLLDSKIWKWGDNLRIFLDEIRRLVSLAYPQVQGWSHQEVLVQKHFVNGIQDSNLRQKLMIDPPDSVESAIQYAERYIAAKQFNRSSFSRDRVRMVRPCDDSDSDSEAESDEELEDMVCQVGEFVRNKLRDPKRSFKFRRYTKSKDGSKRDGSKKGKCFNCGLEGHYRDECPDLNGAKSPSKGKEETQKQ